jgi:predicted transcriptional regulator
LLNDFELWSIEFHSFNFGGASKNFRNYAVIWQLLNSLIDGSKEKFSTTLFTRKTCELRRVSINKQQSKIPSQIPKIYFEGKSSI